MRVRAALPLRIRKSTAGDQSRAQNHARALLPSAALHGVEARAQEILGLGGREYSV